jgi:peptide/nickel transport system permease protein
MAASASPAPLRPSLLGILWRRKTALIGLAILTIVFLLALLADVVSPHDPLAMRISNRLKPPSLNNWFGTDEFGRDIFARVVHGGRISLAVGALTVLFSCSFGVLLGVAAGYFRKLDAALSRIIDGLMALPDILLAIALVAVLSPSMTNVVIALGIVYTPRIARIVRASTLVIRELPYIEATRALGLSTARILFVHILRNLASPIIVQATFIFAYAILSEAGLSFLGVGVTPETPTWGTIIAAGQQYGTQAEWIMMFPGLAIVLTVFSLQMVGDTLRDILDPKLRKDM